MKNHYLISYFGNKRKEVENIYNYCKTLLNNNEINILWFSSIFLLYIYIIS